MLKPPTYATKNLPSIGKMNRDKLVKTQQVQYGFFQFQPLIIFALYILKQILNNVGKLNQDSIQRKGIWYSEIQQLSLQTPNLLYRDERSQ